jgi:hypothetical protein
MNESLKPQRGLIPAKSPSPAVVHDPGREETTKSQDVLSDEEVHVGCCHTLFLLNTAWADVAGRISGMVSDPGGAFLASATMTLTNVGMRSSRGPMPTWWAWVSSCPLDWSPRHKTKRLGLNLSHKALSRSALPKVLLGHRIKPQSFRRNGTRVPCDITLRPSRDGPLCLNLNPLVAGTLGER